MEETGKILGVIGGMGPLATQLFYRELTEETRAETDQEHINMILLSHASMPDRTAAILSGNTDPVYRRLLEDARFLERSGASVIAVPCNTSHFFIPKIRKEIGIPILNMVEETARTLREAYGPGRKIGILATDGTLRTGLYQSALESRGLLPFVPAAPVQKQVMAIIYDGVKKGAPLSKDALEPVEKDLKAAGCHGAVLACTELSFFRREHNPGAYYTDAMTVLVRRAIESCGKTCRLGEEGNASGTASRETGTE